MIVADPSALISLGTVDLHDTLFEEFDVHTTRTVVEELRATAEYEDDHGEAARNVLDALADLEVHEPPDDWIESSRIDAGEGSCVQLAGDLDADFLITDDLRALPELQTAVEARVAISPIVLKAFVERDVLTRSEAGAKLETMADGRDWLGAPIYRRARHLFD